SIGSGCPGAAFAGSNRVSHVPGEPSASMPGSQTPAGPLLQAMQRSGTIPGVATPRTHRYPTLSGFNVRLQRSLSTLRSSNCSESTPDSLPAAGHALPGGIRYPQGSCERFPRFIRYIASPFPKLLVTQCHSVPTLKVDATARQTKVEYQTVKVEYQTVKL